VDPIIYIPAQNSVEAADKLPAGYRLTGQAAGDVNTGAKVYRAVKCGQNESMTRCITRAEAELEASKGKGAVYQQHKKAVEGEVKRVSEGKPEPPPAPSSPAGQRQREMRQSAGMPPTDRTGYFVGGAVLLGVLGVGYYLWRRR